MSFAAGAVSQCTCAHDQALIFFESSFSSYRRRNVGVTFNFEADFDSIENAALQPAAMTSSAGQATTDSYVAACQCDDLASFACDAAPLAPSGILYVCLRSTDDDVELAALSRLELSRGDGERLVVIDGATVQNAEISTVRVKNATAIGVASLIPSRFFSYGGLSTVTVSGSVRTKLTGSRRLVVVDYGTSPAFSEQGAVARAMRRESKTRQDASPFAITIGLEQASDILQDASTAYYNSGLSLAIAAILVCACFEIAS